MISKFTTKLKRLKVKLLSRRVITLLKKTLISLKLINLIEIWNLQKPQIPRSSGPNHQQLGNLQLQRKTRHPRSSCHQQRINSKKINRGSLRSCQKEKLAPNTTIWAKVRDRHRWQHYLEKWPLVPKQFVQGPLQHDASRGVLQAEERQDYWENWRAAENWEGISGWISDY